MLCGRMLIIGPRGRREALTDSFRLNYLHKISCNAG